MIYLCIIHFDAFPNYFQLYLDSIIPNSDLLRIILITDIDISKYNIPPNLLHFNISLEDVKLRAQLFFKKEFNKDVPIEKIIQRPYKLCDFKTIYHILFKDKYELLGINENDYVGWSDVNMIFGKLSSFLNLSNNYNIIGLQSHFTAIKYEEKYLTCYKDINRLFDRLMDERYMLVEENTFIDTFTNKFKSELNLFKMYNYHSVITPQQLMPGHSDELALVLRESELLDNLECNKSSGKMYRHFIKGLVNETIYCYLSNRPMTVEFESYTDSFYINSSSFTSKKKSRMSHVKVEYENEDRVTLVITSCNRSKLLEKTLESFIKYNTYPIHQTLIIDDSTVFYCNSAICKKFPQLNITEIYNTHNLGQIASIDKVYAMVKTNWIFHCEEDWEFLNYGFIEKSFNILKNDTSEKIFTVWLRPHHCTNHHPIVKDTLGRGYFEMMREHSYVNQIGRFTWYGITFNPGLRRTSTCMRFHPYMENCKILLNFKRINEYSVNDIYGREGYYSVILDNPSGHVNHIGYEQSTHSW